MSVLPEVSAARVVWLPCSPHFSVTVAPADRRARLVMWQRMSCSVNSLDPTVNVAPCSEALCARLPAGTLLPPLLPELSFDLKHPAVMVVRATVRVVRTIRSGRRAGGGRTTVLLRGGWDL